MPVPFPSMQPASAPLIPYRPRLQFPVTFEQNHQFTDAANNRHLSGLYSHSPHDPNPSSGSTSSPVSSLNGHFNWLSTTQSGPGATDLSAHTRSTALSGGGDQLESVLAPSPFPRDTQMAPYPPLLTANLANHLAWNDGRTDNSQFNGAFMLAPDQHSPVTPHGVQQVINWMGSENGSVTDSHCSSLPCTPTQPRQTSCRFTSLPSSYQNKSEPSTIYERQPNNMTFNLTDGLTNADYEGKPHWY